MYILLPFLLFFLVSSLWVSLFSPSSFLHIFLFIFFSDFFLSFTVLFFRSFSFTFFILSSSLHPFLIFVHKNRHSIIGDEICYPGFHFNENHQIDSCSDSLNIQIWELTSNWVVNPAVSVKFDSRKLRQKYKPLFSVMTLYLVFTYIVFKENDKIRV